MVFARLIVLVVDVAVQMCLRAESLFALVALVWSFVVSFVVIQLMDLVKFAPADIACKRRGFR